MEQSQKNQKSPLIRQYSAGGAVYREKVSEVPQVSQEWLLINPTNSARWQLPKGTIEPGEKSDVTAMREVFEETGVRGQIVEKIDKNEYFFKFQKDRIFKTVTFYLMSSQGEEPIVDSKWKHEIGKAAWFPFAEALEKLTYKDDKKILEKAQEMVRSRV